jgi:hypothetical protein
MLETPTAPAPAPAPAAPAPAPAPAPASAAPAPAPAFDWKTSGVDEVGLALVNERQWKGPSDLVNSYRNLEKLTGVPADQIVKIPKSADAAEWNAVYDKLGRPKDPAGYKLPVPEGSDGKFAAEVSKWMYEAGLPESAGRKMAEKWNSFVTESAKAEQARMAKVIEAEVATLKHEWGSNYQANSDMIDRAAQSFGMTQEQLGALKVALGPKAAMQFMFNIGSKVAVEDKDLIRNSDGSPAFQGMSPEVARAEIQRLQSDKTFAQQFNSQDPKTRLDARERMRQLQRRGYELPNG